MVSQEYSVLNIFGSGLPINTNINVTINMYSKMSG
jgi:hypothetical protein